MAVVSNGTTLISGGALDSAVPTGSLTLLSTQTASASSSIDFTSGIDSTYDSYIFKFIDIHPSNDNTNFQVNFRKSGDTTFTATKTSTFFRAYHFENDGGAGIGYQTGFDLAQSTGSQSLMPNVGNDNDHCCVGTLQLFNPSSTTFAKHFIFRGSRSHQADFAVEDDVAGYCNETLAITGVQFTFLNGNIDSGIIKMYGVK